VTWTAIVVGSGDVATHQTEQKSLPKMVDHTSLRHDGQVNL
jgi:hypothetical protein